MKSAKETVGQMGVRGGDWGEEAETEGEEHADDDDDDDDDGGDDEKEDDNSESLDDSLPPLLPLLLLLLLLALLGEEGAEPEIPSDEVAITPTLPPPKKESPENIYPA